MVCVCVCVCEKIYHSDKGGAWSSPGPTISEDPENPENPENPEDEEPSLKFSRDTVMVVLFFGKYESTDTSAFRIDKNFFFFKKNYLLFIKNTLLKLTLDECLEVFAPVKGMERNII